MIKDIPLSRPDVSEADIQAVVDVLRTPHLSLGPKVVEFEAAMCRFTGSPYATAVNSGTAALHLAVRGLNIGEGDEVITTPFSFVASANCMLFERARPVFVDIDPVTLNIDPGAIDAAITSRTKAILPVHVFGVPCDMDAIGAIAARHNLHIIEDACEAIGARWNGRSCGTFGVAGTFAFYPNKQMTTGEGGIVLTSDPDLDRVMKSMRNQGRGVGGAWLQHERCGFNYRLADINCALGISQLSRIDELLSARARVADYYSQQLGRLEELVLPAGPRPGAEHSWFVYVVRVTNATRARRDAMLARLRAKGVACSTYFPPIHLQPYFQDMGYRPGMYPITEAVANSTIALPFFNRLSETEIDYIAAALEEALDATRANVAHSVHSPVLQ